MIDGIIYAGGAFRPAADASVSVFDHGLLYGDGVFEGIRAYNGRVFKLERHIERLFESAKAIRSSRAAPAISASIRAAVRARISSSSRGPASRSTSASRPKASRR